MSQKLRSTVAVLALVLLSAGAASARPLASTLYEPSGFMAAAWDWLTSLAGRFGGMWEKEGSSIDPIGQPSSPSEAGRQMDPNGLNKEGSSMDPDSLNSTPCPNGPSTTGTCTPSTDAGSHMDPDGVR